MNLTPLEIAGIAATAAEDKKAREVKTLQIKELSIITDYFVICSANSTTQVKAIADHIEEQLEEKGLRVFHREGMREGRWILLDYGDVVVHVFQEDERAYYNLERLWGDAKTVDV